MRFSIITPLFNRLELTCACIESMERTVRAVDYEWIFIDDGSTDGTRDFLRALPDNGRFRTVFNDTPLGFAANNNLGAKLARAPLLCLLNNDTVLLPRWLEPMARLAELLPDVACVGNVQREPISGLIDHAGVYFQHDGYPCHVAKDASVAPREDYLEWPVVTAACCVIRRRIFLELGGFDEAFRNGSEDVDFCLRAGTRGYRHFVANRSVIYHHISSSPGRMRHEDNNQRLFRERWLTHLQTDLGMRRTRAQQHAQGWQYLRKHAWRPWRYNTWRTLRAVEKILSNQPPSQRLDLAPRLLFQAKDFLRQRKARKRLEPNFVRGFAPSVFMVVGDTAQTADRTGVPTLVRHLAGAFGRMGAQVQPVVWKPVTRSLSLLPPEQSIGLDAEALRPPLSPAWREPSSASISDPALGNVDDPASRTPSLHELPSAGLDMADAWILLPEVMSHGGTALVMDYARRHGWKVAVMVYDTMPNNEPRFFPRGAGHAHEEYLRAVSGADLIITTSGYVADDVRRFGAAKSLPATEWRVCLPPAAASGRPRGGSPTRRDLTGPVRILCVSAVVPRKGHRALLAAFELIAASRPELDLELFLVGKPKVFNEDNVPDAVDRFVRRHPGKVRWSEHVEYGTLCSLYEQCDFTVYPSELEGRGFPIVESLWFGRPCICANFGAMADTAASGGCLTVDVREPQALADAIVSLAASAEKRAVLSAEITARPMKTWEQYADELLSHLRVVGLKQKTPSDLPQTQVPIPNADLIHPRVAAEQRAALNVLFFCHDNFACNSMGHIAGFARGLQDFGHACAVAIPGDDPKDAATPGEIPPFRPFTYSDTWEQPRALFPDGRPADVLHVWTPREHIRRAAELCRQHTPGARLVVHLEDNEEYLSALFVGEDWARLRERSDAELAIRLPIHLAHPREYQRFLASADGVTGITGSLAEFVPPGIPFIELWPGVDFARYHPGPADLALRASLGIGADEKILCYPGSSHFANQQEMQNLYEAVFLLNANGIPTRLIRTAHDAPDFLARFASDDLARYVLHLGFVDRARLPGLLRLADVLVQPGRDDAFNRYRLPSKLPEFLASGRPVLMPHVNVGLRLQPESEALILETGEPAEIARQCQRVFSDPALGQRLSAGAAAFARKNFDPVSNARKLEQFYRRLLATRAV